MFRNHHRVLISVVCAVGVLTGCGTPPKRKPAILSSYAPYGAPKAPPINSRQAIGVPTAPVMEGGRGQAIPVVPLVPAPQQAVPLVPANPAQGSRYPDSVDELQPPTGRTQTKTAEPARLGTVPPAGRATNSYGEELVPPK